MFITSGVNDRGTRGEKERERETRRKRVSRSDGAERRSSPARPAHTRRFARTTYPGDEEMGGVRAVEECGAAQKRSSLSPSTTDSHAIQLCARVYPIPTSPPPMT
ncbi:hypothetical protein SKAU_G00402480 [Synaphobranchus kaupii]|uniref:Uncharacterized protein n=1 Tax=Synaphobranchus kaupii TaxID=118154 RepID=A0A9Q1E997_SYNKA|nr:hypothetical protein SKAU_G00402480 [Synaphobranchus kaupii]